MPSRLGLVHLTAVGQNVQPATLEFGSKLTIIHGASDTGKSHVFELLQFVFGTSQTIEMPPESKGYQYVHLGLRTVSDGIITLVRDVKGGKIGLYAGDHRQLIQDPAPEYLEPRHVSKDPRCISRFLLSSIDLDEQFVRRNQNNVLRMMEWRDVMRLTAVNEEDILSKRAPIESGQYAERPVEASIFRLFVEGQDDSGLIPIPKVAELKKVSASKLEILDLMISQLEDQLENVPSVDELRLQLGRLNQTTRNSTTELEGSSGARDALIVERSLVSATLVGRRERHDEVTGLEGRFLLLLAQYDSDLARLELVAQAADTLSLSAEESCPFCGAAPDHQHWPGQESDDVEVAMFAAAVDSERSKITVLRQDLVGTISEISSERANLLVEISTLNATISRLTAEIREQDVQVRGQGAGLDETLEIRSRVERQIDTHDRLLDLLSLRVSVAQVDRPKTSAEVPISASDLHAFDMTAERILKRWSFSTDSSVQYLTADRDLVVDQRPRRTRGKGVRSILHALFNVALAEHCIERDLSHPGLVILDSPVVTYRQPGEPEKTGEDETVSVSVVDAFYAYLQDEFAGQSVILENKSPLSPLPSGTKEYFFDGGTEAVGRPGFYPTGR